MTTETISVGRGVVLDGLMLKAGLMAFVPFNVWHAEQLVASSGAETATESMDSEKALESGRIVTLPAGSRSATDIRVSGPGKFHVSSKRGLGSIANCARSQAVAVSAMPSSTARRV